MEFKEKVKYARGEMMITQEELAKQIGVSFTTINRWEAGKTEPRLIELKKFENFCNANKIALPKD